MSRRRHRHEEHENHEAWAIPYGDLVTLLLAFFVVMYAISNVNEGKYRALSDSLNAAFRGTPRSPDPINVGDRNTAAKQGSDSRLDPQGNMIGTNASMMQTTKMDDELKRNDDAQGKDKGADGKDKEGMSPMDQIVGQVEATMAEQIQQQTLKVKRKGNGVEIEISTDSLFSSGSANMSPASVPVIQRLADTLKPLPYPMRVEGHTDNRPINTALFPSNWELSAARAATVVHLFTERGVDPSRLAVIGLGEFRPQEDNATEAGRNANRRVKVIILSDGENPQGDKMLSDMAAELSAENEASAESSSVSTTP